MSEALSRSIQEAFLPNPPRSLGVAVSGGGDSMALLQLLNEFCKEHHMKLYAATVDHQLRPEAADEAAMVAAHCRSIGISHDTLVWENWDGKGNLQQSARDARYLRMSKWARCKGIDAIALGHTADDQAETLLMGLSRRSGVDGLTGMQGRVLRYGVTWVRPLLRARRPALRAYLDNQKIGWKDDPSNEDLSYERIRVRKALELLVPLGIDAESLTEVAEQMGAARNALEWHSFIAAKEMAAVEYGSVIFDDRQLRILPDEIQRRLLHKAISWVSGSDQGPRREALMNIRRALQDGQAATAVGCQVRRIAGDVWVFREFNAVRDKTVPVSGRWDRRWKMTPPENTRDCSDFHIRALGKDGIEQCPDWRTSGRPHVVVLSSPSVWQGDTLVSAPLAGYAQNWHAEVIGSGESFFAALLTH